MKFAPRKIRNLEAQAKVETEFRNRLAEAQKINAPADRLEAMLQLDRDMGKYVGGIFGAMIDRTMIADVGGIVGTILTGMGLAAAAMVLATPLVGIPVLFATIGGGMYGMIKLDPSDRLQRRMENEIKPHLTALNEMLVTIDGDTKNLLKNCTNEIAASDKFDSLYDRYPSIRDSFIKAFNKAVALKELPPPPAPPNSTRKFAL